MYLGNISEDTRERDVEKFFKSYGRIRNIVLKVRKEKVIFLENTNFFCVQGTYGFCEFDDLRDAQDAVRDLDGKNWLGGRVRIEHARDSRNG